MSIQVTENYYTKDKCSAGSNFWQGLGMGVLGQLTGMGGYGLGGYGIGGYGYGCCGGPSVWNMSGMYNCGFGGYGMGYGYGGYGMGYGFGNAYGMYDAYAGAQVVDMGLGILFQGLSGYISEKKAAKAERAEIVSTASNNIEALKEEIKALQDENNKLDVKINYDSSVPEAVKTACSSESTTFTNACNAYTKLEQKELSEFYSDVPDIKGKQSEISTLTSETDPDGTKKADLEKEIETLAQAEKTRQLQSLAEQRADAKQKLEAAIDAKIEANEKEIQKKQADLKNETDKLGETYTGKIDNQERYEQVVGKYDANTNNFEKAISNKNYDNYVEAFKFKYRQYNNEKDATKKENLKKEATALYDKISDFKADVPKDVKSFYNKMVGAKKPSMGLQ